MSYAAVCAQTTMLDARIADAQSKMLEAHTFEELPDGACRVTGPRYPMVVHVSGGSYVEAYIVARSIVAEKARLDVLMEVADRP